MYPRILLLVALSLSVSITDVSAREKVDPALEQLRAQLTELDNDPSLATLGDVERLRARQSLSTLETAKSRDREQALYLAERRVAAARHAAEAELLEEQARELDRERDRILLDASRRDAQLARREAERLRLQSLARQEEALRYQEDSVAQIASRDESLAQAQKEAELARKLAASRAREAELARQEAELASSVIAGSMAADAPLPPSRQQGGDTIYTLAGNAFASGRATLTTEAQASLRKLASQLVSGSGAIRIEGHTDSQGADAANLALSSRRAQAVLSTLADAGVSGGRMQAVGLGKSQPIADNGTESGRASNRRVEIIVGR